SAATRMSALGARSFMHYLRSIAIPIPYHPATQARSASKGSHSTEPDALARARNRLLRALSPLLARHTSPTRKRGRTIQRRAPLTLAGASGSVPPTDPTRQRGGTSEKDAARRAGFVL